MSLVERGFENTRIIDVCDSFNEYDTTVFLQEIGMIGGQNLKFIGSVKQFVFSYGDSEQIFTPLEIRFMERFDRIIVYDDFFESTGKAEIKCRLVALKFKGTIEEETCLSLAIGKILDKSFDGFTMCMFFSERRLYIGCNKFNNSNLADFILSQPIYSDEQLELLEDNLYYLSDEEGFLGFYLYFLQLVNEVIALDYAAKEYKKMKKSNNGLNNLCFNHDDMQDLIQLGRSAYDNVESIDINALQKDCNDYLAFIKKKEYNSLEAWFDTSVIDDYFELPSNNDERIKDEKSEADKELEKKIELLDDPDQLMKMIRKGRYKA